MLRKILAVIFVTIIVFSGHGQKIEKVSGGYTLDNGDLFRHSDIRYKYLSDADIEYIIWPDERASEIFSSYKKIKRQRNSAYIVSIVGIGLVVWGINYSKRVQESSRQKIIGKLIYPGLFVTASGVFAIFYTQNKAEKRKKEAIDHYNNNYTGDNQNTSPYLQLNMTFSGVGLVYHF